MAEEHNQAPPRKEKKTNCPAGAPAWMVTYSDLVTLLLTFFVLLLSMSNMDPVRFVAATSSIQDAFGVQKKSDSVEFAIPLFPNQPKADYSPIRINSIEKVYDKVKSQIDSLRLNDDIGLIKNDDDSITLRITDSVLFAPGQAELAKSSLLTLRNVAEIIRPLPMDLRIEGHTDDTPMSGPKTANWDLSVNRSVAVLRYFTQADLLPLDRMAAVGYGEERPLVANTDEAGRAQNRRVDFVLRLQSNRLLHPTAVGSGNVPL